VVSKGRDRIAVRLQHLFDQGMRLKPAGASIQYDRFVAEPVRFYNASGSGTGVGMFVFVLDAHNKIATVDLSKVSAPVSCTVRAIERGQVARSAMVGGAWRPLIVRLPDGRHLDMRVSGPAAFPNLPPRHPAPPPLFGPWNGRLTSGSAPGLTSRRDSDSTRQQAWRHRRGGDIRACRRHRRETLPRRVQAVLMPWPAPPGSTQPRPRS
jgi:hypothetical protein